MKMERMEFNGWSNCYRLTDGRVELVVTADIGPRIVRFGRVGGANMFREMPGQQGGSGEGEWMIRGGHRLWLAPEEKPLTYELDNGPVRVETIRGGLRTVQPRGPLSGVQKTMDITMDEAGLVRIVHTLVNRRRRAVKAAPWALTVMDRGGVAIIPLPAKISHADRLTHNQEWSLWGYTDFTDPRWTLGSRYILFRQDPQRGPNKLGLAHREGWVAYAKGGDLFVKYFGFKERGRYPDGGVNFETFSNEDILELESLGPLASLAPGRSVHHTEYWQLSSGIGAIKSEADVDKRVLPAIAKPAGL